jgi:AcrR family transcriptional regulator
VQGGEHPTGIDYCDSIGEPICLFQVLRGEQRKKLAAMRRIQEVALDLFDQRGFADVTIEEIADSADVSPSSIYRYFGTKEQVVLWDDFDIQFFNAADAALVSKSPVQAMRTALAETMTQFYERDETLARRKTRYALEEPALRPALMETTDEFAHRVAEGLRSSDAQLDELEADVTAAAMVWAMMAASRHWLRSGFEGSIREELERALDIVERGL